MLLHMGMKHHWWHLALRRAVWVHKCLERASLPPRTSSYELLFEKKPDLTLARVWGCMVQFMVLDLTNNRVVTTVEAIFYESMSLEEWKVEHGPASARTKDSPLTGPLPASIQLLEAEDDVGEQVGVGVKSLPIGEPSSGKRVSEKPLTGEPLNEELASEERATEEQLDDGTSSDVVEVIGSADGELSTGEQFSDSDMVEVSADKLAVRCSTRSNFGKPPERLSYHVCLPPTSYDTLLDDAQFDVDLPELDPDMHADPEHRWDIANMTVKEGLASWKGKAVKAAMDEEIRSLISNGTWELVERLRGVNSKLDCVLYMDQPACYNDGTGRVCKLLKSLYGLKQSPLLYSALDAVLTGAGWSKSPVDEALYFRVGDDGLACWVLVYVDDLLAASSSNAMLKELKELLKAAFELREISPVEKYLGLKTVRDRPARKLWLHQQSYVDKLRRRFIDEEQTGQRMKTPISVDAYAELTSTMRTSSRAKRRSTVRRSIRCSSLPRQLDPTSLESGLTPVTLKLVGYVDADDAGDKQTCSNTNGYVSTFGGAAVSWTSQRIKCVTLSSTDFEYIAATEAGKKARRLRFLLAEF
ncbi:unnamed protein product [Closterium sp. NIES-54]